MDDVRREALLQQLRDARAERDQLDAVIAYLSRVLGVEAVSPDDADSEGERRTTTNNTGQGVGGANPLVLVSEGEFWGMSGPKASYAMLKKAGRSRPLKTEELWECIHKGGVNLSGKNPAGTLYRSLFRDQRFQRVGRGLWGLSEWYPQRKGGKPGDAPLDGMPGDPEGDAGTETGEEETPATV